MEASEEIAAYHHQVIEPSAAIDSSQNACRKPHQQRANA